jgi:hypothetical protein
VEVFGVVFDYFKEFPVLVFANGFNNVISFLGEKEETSTSATFSILRPLVGFKNLIFVSPRVEQINELILINPVLFTYESEHFRSIDPKPEGPTIHVLVWINLFLFELKDFLWPFFIVAFYKKLPILGLLVIFMALSFDKFIIVCYRIIDSLDSNWTCGLGENRLSHFLNTS